MKYQLLSLTLVAVSLAACTGPVIMGSDAAVIYATKPSTPPGPDLAAQIPQHESWCYETAGYAECYAHPQRTSPGRLINVDPPSSYPVDPAAYRQALKNKGGPTVDPVTATQAPVMLKPVTVQPVQQPPLAQPPDLQAEKAGLKDEINRDNAAGTPVTSAP